MSTSPPRPHFFARFTMNKIRLTLLVAVFFTLLASTVYRTPSLVFMVGLLLSTIVFSSLVGRWSSRRLQVMREVPAQLVAGEATTVHLRLISQSRWPVLLAKLRVPSPVPITTTALQAATSPNDTVNAAILQHGNSEYETPILRPHDSIEWRQRWQFLQRGVYCWPCSTAGSTDPLSLFEHLHPQGEVQETIVLPRPVSPERLGFRSGASSGAHRTVVSAPSSDAADLHGIRRWHPGEAVRRVHWKSTARTGHLHVVEWEEHPAGDLCVLLDTQRAALAGNALENTLESSIILVASMAAFVLESGYRFQFLCWQEETTQDDTTLAPRLVYHDAYNPLSLNSIYQTLARIVPVTANGTSLQDLVRESAKISADGAVLISSSNVSFTAALEQLRANQRGQEAFAFIFDAATFLPETTPSSFVTLGRAQSGVRLVAKNESLTTVLEHPF
jgi:hypothetical protein